MNDNAPLAGPNRYETDEEERDAGSASHAGQARAAIWRYVCATNLECDEWAAKVLDVLYDATSALEDLERGEVRDRPGMLAAGRAWRIAREAKHDRFEAEVVAAELTRGATSPTTSA